MADTGNNSRTARWFSIAAVWCAVALFDASQTVLIMQSEGRHHNWLPLFAIEFVSWSPWALATPVIIRLARRYPIDRHRLARPIAVHLATFLIVGGIAESLSAELQTLFNPWNNRKWPTFVDTWITSALYQALTFVIVYALILSVTLIMDARGRLSRQAAETARLNEELSRSQLAALRRQMEPHFMFNTLNSIAGLVREKSNEAAVNMIVRLSEFLRRATEDAHRAEVTLAEEVDYLERYLDLQRIRFGERLQVSIDIPPELLHAQVPSLLLQPLVENAIKHGIAKRISGGVVRIVATGGDGALRLTIYNDTPGGVIDWRSAHTGVGLGNLRTRLQILYGSGFGLELKCSGPAGVEVDLTLPWRDR